MNSTGFEPAPSTWRLQRPELSSQLLFCPVIFGMLAHSTSNPANILASKGVDYSEVTMQKRSGPITRMERNAKEKRSA
jgi:hypothetical protein